MDDACGATPNPEGWDLEVLRRRMKRIANVVWEESDESLRDLSREELRTRLLSELRTAVGARREEMSGEVLDRVARMLVLQFSDQLWKDHLLAVDRLRQGVSLRGYGQRNPLLEYKREAYHMYLMMEAMRDEEVLKNLINADPAAAGAAASQFGKATARQVAARGLQAPQAAAGPATDALSAVGLPSLPAQVGAGGPARPAAPAAPPAKGAEALAVIRQHGLGKNDPCPCGSGQKIKKCCGKGQDISPIVVEPAAPADAGALDVSGASPSA